MEGVRSSSAGCTPCGKQKCAASGVIATSGGYWYSTWSGAPTFLGLGLREMGRWASTVRQHARGAGHRRRPARSTAATTWRSLLGTGNMLAFSCSYGILDTCTHAGCMQGVGPTCGGKGMPREPRCLSWPVASGVTVTFRSPDLAAGREGGARSATAVIKPAGRPAVSRRMWFRMQQGGGPPTSVHHVRLCHCAPDVCHRRQPLHPAARFMQQGC